MSDCLPPALFRLLLTRLFVMGRPGVAISALLAGSINALKPIGQAQAGLMVSALSSVAKSAFRRTGRSVFPAAKVKIASWVLCQRGAYRIAKRAASAWLRDTSPSQARLWLMPSQVC